MDRIAVCLFLADVHSPPMFRSMPSATRGVADRHDGGRPRFASGGATVSVRTKEALQVPAVRLYRILANSLFSSSLSKGTAGVFASPQAAPPAPPVPRRRKRRRASATRRAHSSPSVGAARPDAAPRGGGESAPTGKGSVSRLRASSFRLWRWHAAGGESVSTPRSAFRLSFATIWGVFVSRLAAPQPAFPAGRAGGRRSGPERKRAW